MSEIATIRERRPMQLPDPIDDTLLRLAVWLADVSVEAAAVTPSFVVPSTPRGASSRRPTPTRIHSLVGTARR